MIIFISNFKQGEIWLGVNPNILKNQKKSFKMIQA